MATSIATSSRPSATFFFIFSRPSSTFFFIFFFLLLSPHASLSCTNQTSLQIDGNFSLQLSSLLLSLQLFSSSHLYHFNSTGTSSGSLNAMYQCRGDLTFLQCSDCLSQAINDSNKSCPNGAANRVDEDTCTLIYRNDTITADNSLLWYAWNLDNNTDATFRSNRDKVLYNVTTSAPANGGYSSISYFGGSLAEVVYGLAQCHGYLSQSECDSCLSASVTKVQELFQNSKGGRANSGSCYYRFEAYVFFAKSNPTAGPLSPSPSALPTPSASNTGKQQLVVTILAVSMGCLVVILICICAFLRMRKKWEPYRNTASQDASPKDSVELKSGLQHKIQLFSLEQMKRATNNFHDDHKLGEGGFGSVYKGRLDDGEIVAIKKLSRPTQKGERQFLIEVELITSVQHRNLITLLGCCGEGSERMLVYEYAPNQSLDKHLFFDVQRRPILSWNGRHEILLGTAKGLAYLHHDSHVRIVHRDIKAANILLDDNMQPKISDFGLARLFKDGQTHVSTQVAGTLGYLAPECAMHGQLTEKSDIYSFGLVILEILSGRRVMETHLPEQQQYLLGWAWRLYQEVRQVELVDPLLGDNYSVDEAIRWVHVALLCTHGVVGLRPPMNEVVMLLSGRSEILDIPTKPSFLVSSVIQVESEGSENYQNHERKTPLYVPPQTFSPAKHAIKISPTVAKRSQYTVNSITDIAQPR